MNITVTPLTARDSNEFIQMLRLFGEVFEMKDFRMPAEKHLKKLLRSKNFISFIALHENAVIGGLTAHLLPSYYCQSSEVYLYDIAVKADFQRKGIGKKLLQALTAYCRENNFKTFLYRLMKRMLTLWSFIVQQGAHLKRWFTLTIWLSKYCINSI